MARVEDGAGGRTPRATRAQVAALAGVSVATVSFVLNPGSGQTIRPETRQRVLDAVAQLGYRPNRAAQGLRTGRTATVGFVTLDHSFGAFAGPAIVGAHEAALAHDSLLLIESASRDAAVVGNAVDDLIDRRVDGIIFAVEGTREVALPESVATVPSVLVDCFVKGGALPCVLPDEVGGGRDATRVLLQRGHRRLAYLTGNRDAWATRARLRGFRQALVAAGIDPAEQTVLAGNFHVDSGYELTRTLLGRAELPTGILCGNDRMAVGCLLALLDQGVRVPQEVSVMGYDDQQGLAAELRPALSTVQLPYYAMGRWAVERLFASRRGGLPRRTLLPCPVVLRDSVAVPRAER